MAFYDVFERLCGEKGVTPTQVARDNGLTQQTVSHWKTRNSTPKAETVQKLADYFGVSVDYLLGKSDSPVMWLNFGNPPDLEFLELERKIEDGTITPDELQRYKGFFAQLIKFRRGANPERMKELLEVLDGLPESGLRVIIATAKQMKAERVQELAETLGYKTEEAPQDAPQSTPAPQEGKDTTPPPALPKTPPDGK